MDPDPGGKPFADQCDLDPKHQLQRQGLVKSLGEEMFADFRPGFLLSFTITDKHILTYDVNTDNNNVGGFRLPEINQ